MMENLLISFLLVSLLKELNHETPQNVIVRVEAPIQQDCIEVAPEKLCRESDARWYPAVSHAMPSSDNCSQKGLR